MHQYLLYQAYGLDDVINECKYSLLRLIAVYRQHNQMPPAVVIYTDRPAAFEIYGQQLELVIIPVTQHQITNWKGPHQFVHLVKVNVIRDCLQRFGGMVLYCDTDTFCEQPLSAIFDSISTQNVFFHEYEGNIGHTHAFRKWKRFFENNPLQQLEQYSPLQIEMWNAGTLGLQQSHLPLLDEVHELTNALYSRFKKHIAEQFAFCYVTQRHGLQISSAKPFIFHYWNLKEYRTLLAGFFIKYEHLPVEQLMEKSEAIPPEKMLAEKLSYRAKNPLAKTTAALLGRQWRIQNYTY